MSGRRPEKLPSVSICAWLNIATGVSNRSIQFQHEVEVERDALAISGQFSNHYKTNITGVCMMRGISKWLAVTAGPTEWPPMPCAGSYIRTNSEVDILDLSQSITNMSIGTRIPLEDIPYHTEEHTRDRLRVYIILEDPTAFYNQVANDIEKDPVHPDRFRAFRPVRCDSIEGADIEDLT